MSPKAFDTAIVDDGTTLAGPWRAPKQMLAAQVYDGHASIHDDAVAQKMGFKAATIEGPTASPRIIATLSLPAKKRRRSSPSRRQHRIKPISAW